MKLRYIESAALLFWGYQADLLLFALPMAAIFEARFHTNRRWALTKQDFYRVADLTSLALFALIVFLFLNRAEYHFITSLVQWLPIVFFPLVVVLAFSTTEKMPLDILFYSLRRQREPVTQAWDMNYVFFGICLVAAGTNTDAVRLYMLIASLLVLLALFRLRSPRYASNLWILLACLVFLSAYASQHVIRAGHLALKEQTREWLANYIRTRTNALRTRTAIGSVGNLKLSDAISFRVRPLTDGRFPRLLQEATYDVLADTDWLVLNPQFSRVDHSEDFRWRLAGPQAAEQRARIYLAFERDIDIVPVPANATEIDDLPAQELRKSRFGSVEAIGLVPSPGYAVSFAAGADINSDPEPSDKFIPHQYAELMRGIFTNVDVPDSEPIRKVKALFADFRYSLYQDIPPTDDPIEYFLTQSHAGHCEYFATATVLLLRQLGVPARYAVGYALQEYDSSLGMFIVRKRHAHAWAIAFVDGGWQVVDTTPGVWAESEAAQAGLLRPLVDMLANGAFRLQLWWNEQKLEDYQLELYGIGALLALILIWRIATSEQVIIRSGEAGSGGRSFDAPGMDSPFFRIEAHLSAAGLRREPGEVFSAWLARIGHTDLFPLLRTHNRLRFDPRGLREEKARQLDDAVEAWLRAQ